MKPEVLRALAAAGATAEMIVAAVEAEHAADEAKLTARRAKDAARKRAQREREKDEMSRDVTRTHAESRGVTDGPADCPSSPSMVSPITPSLTTPPPLSSLRSLSSISSDWPADFRDWFWQAYPRRLGKAVAMRKLEAIRRGGAVPWAVFSTGVTRYAEAMRGTEPQFIKQPATWLNAGCWDDDPNGLARGSPNAPNGFTRMNPTSRQNGDGTAGKPNGLVAAGQRRIAELAASIAADDEAERRQQAEGADCLFAGHPDVRLLPARGRG